MNCCRCTFKRSINKLWLFGVCGGGIRFNTWTDQCNILFLWEIKICFLIPCEKFREMKLFWPGLGNCEMIFEVWSVVVVVVVGEQQPVELVMSRLKGFITGTIIFSYLDNIIKWPGERNDCLDNLHLDERGSPCYHWCCTHASLLITTLPPHVTGKTSSVSDQKAISNETTIAHLVGIIFTHGFSMFLCIINDCSLILHQFALDHNNKGKASIANWYL